MFNWSNILLFVLRKQKCLYISASYCYHDRLKAVAENSTATNKRQVHVFNGEQIISFKRCLLECDAVYMKRFRKFWDKQSAAPNFRVEILQSYKHDRFKELHGEEDISVMIQLVTSWMWRPGERNLRNFRRNNYASSSRPQDGGLKLSKRLIHFDQNTWNHVFIHIATRR